MNSWRIKKARKLQKISHRIEDTFDTDKEGPAIFQPTGTNIKKGENFLLNSAGVSYTQVMIPSLIHFLVF